NDGTILSYTYDALGRKRFLKSSDGTIDYSFRYDKNDNLILAKDKINRTAIQRGYDFHNQLISERFPTGHTLSYAYDPLGNLKLITLPDQTQIFYKYLGDRLLAIKRKGSLAYTHAYQEYDQSSNPTHISLPANAGTLSIQYDLLNRPLNMKSSSWEETLEYGAKLLDKRILRDTFGKIVSTYTYDAKEQLLTEKGVAEHSFEYDWQGNPIKYDGHSRKFNACNALIKANKLSYQYDINGNRLSDEVNTYKYDALDRLIEVKTPEGNFKYVYDALNRRISRTHRDKTTFF